MIGIYKIASPSKRIYIGQSIDIERRKKEYLNLQKCKHQVKLFYSLKKYGFAKHKFEIICECAIEELNDKERYYQELYSAIGANGLNLKLTESKDISGKLSEETLIKMRLYQKNRPEEHQRKINEAFRIKRAGKPHSKFYRKKRKLTSRPKTEKEIQQRRNKNRKKYKLKQQNKIAA